MTVVKTDNKLNQLELLWKNYNISTILLLKIFDKICINCFNKNVPYLQDYPIHYLFSEYGMIQAYLNDKDDKLSLMVVCDYKKAIKNKNIITSFYINFINRLIDTYELHSIKNINDVYLLLDLKINEELYDDIKKITKGKYSSTSKKFKKLMLMDYKRYKGIIVIPRINNKLLEYLCSKNIPYKIMTKDIKLKKDIIKLFNLPVNINIGEYFNKWFPEKELWSLNKYKYGL